jgi:formimidoylglutamate deiminase
VCPTTEANLGDGFLPVARVLHRKIGLCVGSDSNVRIDPLEELRELEGIARRQTGKRGVMSIDDLLAAGSTDGAAALGLDEWPDATIDLTHPQLRGVDEAAVYDALVFGCAGSVLWKTSDQ